MSENKKSVWERAKEIHPAGTMIDVFMKTAVEILEQDVKEMIHEKFAEVDALVKD